jgi:hypothetical protein
VQQLQLLPTDRDALTSMDTVVVAAGQACARVCLETKACAADVTGPLLLTYTTDQNKTVTKHRIRVTTAAVLPLLSSIMLTTIATLVEHTTTPWCAATGTADALQTVITNTTQQHLAELSTASEVFLTGPTPPTSNDDWVAYLATDLVDRIMLSILKQETSTMTERVRRLRTARQPTLSDGGNIPVIAIAIFVPLVYLFISLLIGLYIGKTKTWSNLPGRIAIYPAYLIGILLWFVISICLIPYKYFAQNESFRNQGVQLIRDLRILL